MGDVGKEMFGEGKYEELNNVNKKASCNTCFY